MPIDFGVDLNGLPTSVQPGDSGHSALHNGANAALRLLLQGIPGRVDELADGPALRASVTTKASLPAAERNALTGWFHAAGFGAKGDGTTNDTPAIQAAVDAANAAGGGVVYLQTTGAATGGTTVYALDATLVLRSGVELRAGVAVTVTRGSTLKSSVIRNAASYPTTYASGGAATAGSTTLTVASGAFTSADVGKSIVITGAGPTYTGGSPHQATISSVTNATTVVLSAAPATTVSSAGVRVYGRDRDIAITGELGARLLLGASGQQNNLAAIPVYLRNIDRVRVGARNGLMFVQTTDTEGGGKYALDFYACTNWVAENIRFDTGSDGVHIVGKTSNFIVRNIYGDTGDDSVAIVGNERLTSTNTDGDLGDVTNFVIENVQTNAGAGTNGVKLLPCRAAGASVGFTISRGTVRNVSGSHGSTNNTGSAVVIGAANEQGAESVYALGQVDNILVDNATSTNQPGVSIFNIARGRNIVLSRVKNVRVANRAVVEDLTIRDSYFDLPAGAYAVDCGPGGGTVGIVGPQIGALRIQNCRLNVATTTGGLVSAIGDGTTLGSLTVSGYTCLQAAWALGQFSTVTDIYGDGLSLAANNVAAVSGTGVLRFRALNQSTSLTGFGKYDSGTVRGMALSVKADVSALTAVSGDLATNTNAALACGVGPVATDGTGWRNIASNAVYAFTKPGAPGLSVTAGNGQNLVSFTNPANNGGSAITVVKVWRATSAGVVTTGTPLKTITDGSTSFTDSGLTNGTTYYYVAKAGNGVGDGDPSTEQSATPSGTASNARPATPSTSTSPSLWLRADKVVTSGGNVTQMTDQSATGAHAVVPSGANAPTWNDAVLAGQPVVSFSGGSTQRLLSPLSHSTENYTILVVFRVPTIASASAVVAAATADGTAKVNTGANTYTGTSNANFNGQTVKTAGGSYGSAASANNAVAANTALIGRFSVGAGSGHTQRVGINGTLGTSVTPGAFTAVTAAALGIGGAGTDWGTVDIAEVLFLPGMSDTDVHSWTTYLATTYGITSVGAN